MPTPRHRPARRPRPHPAQRARKLAGTISVAGVLILTGCMAATTPTNAGAVTTSTTASTPTAATDDTTPTTGSMVRSINAAAVSGSVSYQSDTSTNAS